MPLSLKLIVPLNRGRIEQNICAHLKELTYKINHPLFNGMVILVYEYKCTDINITIDLHYIN